MIFVLVLSFPLFVCIFQPKSDNFPWPLMKVSRIDLCALLNFHFKKWLVIFKFSIVVQTYSKVKAFSTNFFYANIQDVTNTRMATASLMFF